MQMHPSFSTGRMTNKVFSKSQLVDISCPQGMVPIQRTKVDQGQTHDLKSFSEFHGGSFNTFATKKFSSENVSFFFFFSLNDSHCFLQCIIILIKLLY
jgi:hypothetical protein